MAKTIENLFYWLAFATDALIIFWILLIYSQSKRLGSTWLLLIYTLVNLAINALVELFHPKSVYTIYTGFTLIEYLLFSLFIFSFTKNLFFRKLIIVLCILFSLALPTYYITTGQHFLDSVPIGVETIFILLFSFYYFYEQMNDIENHYIYNRFHFWIVTGMIIYLSGSFFIYIFANHVDRELLFKYWFLTYIFYVLKNILFIAGITIYGSSLSKHKPLKELHPYLN
jgi:hypothetical protein